MSHHITKFQFVGQQRETWLSRSNAAITRLLGSRDAVDAVGEKHINDELVSGRWQLTPEDIGTEQGSALWALMSNGYCRVYDLGAEPSTTDPVRIMDADKQALALTLAEHGCNPLQRCAFTTADILDWAIVGNAPAIMDKLLGDTPWQERTAEGYRWVHLAAMSGMVDMLKVLKKHGADLELQDDKGNTPLFYASEKECVQWLVEQGVDQHHLNHKSMDARSHWMAVRSILGPRLEGMRAALGKSNANKIEPDKAIEQFLEISLTGASGLLAKEIRRLRITGNERNEAGQGVFGTAAERIKNSIRYKDSGSGSLTSARKWFDKVCEWPEAVNAANKEEMGLAIVLAEMLYMEAAKSLVENAKTRGWKLEDLQLTGWRKLVKSDIEIGHGALNWVGERLCQRPDFLREGGDILTNIARDLDSRNQGYKFTAALSAALAKEDPQSSGWQQPGLMATIMRLAFPVATGNYNLDHERKIFRELLPSLWEHGIQWDDEAQEVLAGILNGKDRQAAFEIQVEFERSNLSRQTPAASAPGRSGMRL